MESFFYLNSNGQTIPCRLTRQLRFLLAHLLREFGKDSLNRNVSAFLDVNGFD